MKWNSRKLIVALATATTATALLTFGKIDAGIWQWVISITVGAYLASQGVADALGRR